MNMSLALVVFVTTIARRKKDYSLSLFLLYAATIGCYVMTTLGVFCIVMVWQNMFGLGQWSQTRGPVIFCGPLWH